jgi:GNAT superfamily N-acetyltransferase
MHDRTSAFAFKDGKSAGFCLWERGTHTPFQANPGKWWKPFGWVHVVFSDSQFRGKGLGGLFYKTIEEKTLEMGLDELHADVYENNPGSIRFHEKLGFEYYACIAELKVKSFLELLSI